MGDARFSVFTFSTRERSRISFSSIICISLSNTNRTLSLFASFFCCFKYPIGSRLTQLYISLAAIPAAISCPDPGPVFVAEFSIKACKAATLRKSPIDPKAMAASICTSKLSSERVLSNIGLASSTLNLPNALDKYAFPSIGFRKLSHRLFVFQRASISNNGISRNCSDKVNPNNSILSPLAR